MLDYAPGDVDASLGLARVLLKAQYRSGRAASYFQEGVRDFQDLLLPSADRNLGLTVHYDEDHERAPQRKDQVAKLLVEERLAEAEGFADHGLWFAARNEYRLALILDPDNETARVGFDRFDREARASRALADVQMHIRRADFDQAEDRLAEALVLTELQTDEVGRLRGEIEDARLAAIYDRARTFERDLRFNEAAEAYTDLLEKAPYYEDAISRRATMEEFIERAEATYAAAMEAATAQEKYDLLSQIPVFWPEYRDVETLLAELRPHVQVWGSSELLDEDADSEAAQVELEPRSTLEELAAESGSDESMPDAQAQLNAGADEAPEPDAAPSDGNDPDGDR